MQIKRKDLKMLVKAIRQELSDHDARSLTAMWQALVVGNRILRMSHDPVDVVPVQDYPFPIPTPKHSVNIPDMVKPASEGPT